MLTMKIFFIIALLCGYVINAQIYEKDRSNLVTSYTKSAQPAPTYIVDLDLPPKERWNEALSHFDPESVKNAINLLLGEYIHSKLIIKLIYRLSADLESYIPLPFANELRGVANALDADLGLVVFGNLVYDITSFNKSRFGKACTSIVSLDKDNNIIHGRNLDYDVPDILKKLTFQADFRKNGKHLFMATTYAGYISVLTGARHGAFTVSGNERDSGGILENLLSALENSWSSSFLIRTVLEIAEDYNSAVNYFKTIPTISPIFFIVGGLQPEEGAIIVKNRWNVLNVTSLNKNRWFVIETNYDPWTAPPPSDDRRDAGISAMNKIGRENMNSTQLYKVLSSHLVFNQDTTYTTIMSAKDASVYKTMIRSDAPPP